MRKNRRSSVSYLFADVFLTIALALLAGGSEGGRGAPQPSEVLEVSADVQNVRFRGRWVELSRFNPGELAGRCVGLVVLPKADAGLVLGFQLALMQAGVEVVYADR